MTEVMVEREGNIETNMPPQSQIQQFSAQISVALKRKIEEEPRDAATKKKHELYPPKKEESFPQPGYPIEFSPPRVEESPSPDISPLRREYIPPVYPSDCPQQVPAKRKLANLEEPQQPVKRHCSYKEMAEDSRPPSTLEEPLILSLPACAENKENLVCLRTIAENQTFDSILAKTLLAARADRRTELSPRVVVEHQDLPSIYELGQIKDLCSLEDEEEDSDEDSSMFDTPPKSGFDRFWTTSSMSSTTTTTPVVSTYQFLDQNNQRIECDENGKSYLQLGTVNHHHHHHHHIPVTPVLQPKPTTLTPRRPISVCRPSLPPRPPNPTPPCEDMHLSPLRGCSSSSCYRQQRSDMLNLSLHKLHMARQRSDSSLRRSVLICNMLRYIEEESTTEQRHQEAAAYQLQSAAAAVEQPYWNNVNVQTVSNFIPPPTPNPYRENGFGSENFEAPLKDFNSAFRQSPPILSSDCESEEEDRGINWSSVLSLTSQHELDPLNNNTYSESSELWSCAGSDLSDVDLSQTSFDDVSWKLSPISADEVMKAFPEETMFECAA